VRRPVAVADPFDGTQPPADWRHMVQALATGLRGEVGTVSVIETHISVVLLAGERAYKLKKPVDLGFVDFTTLPRRRHFCREELRVNRRLAPQLYLSVLSVTGSMRAPRLGGRGRAIDYAVEMRRFPGDALLADALAAGRLSGEQVDALAACVADFHRGLPALIPDSPYGRSRDLLRAARDNFTALAAGAGPRTQARLRVLAEWTEREYRRRHALLAGRRRAGWVRECHGDLHLGNIVWLDGRPVPFDGIEFDPALRWQDVQGELAFLTMDLARRGRPDLARRARDRYLQATGDYAGVPLVDFFEVYRALVRAKVARLKAAGAGQGARFAALRECLSGLRLAETLIRPRRPYLAITHGLSGSGKTHYADWLLEQTPLVRLRSDVERKRLLGLQPRARTDSGTDEGAYRRDITAATYRHLAATARCLLLAGWPVLVDASFLDPHERRRFARLAARLGVPFHIVVCTAPPPVLERRVAARAAQGTDASEAGAVVLAVQQARYRPLSADEQARAIVVDTSQPYVLPDRCAAQFGATG
jgi:aminoglycoside phosphotransferase family enzyme/predicted kinase